VAKFNYTGSYIKAGHENQTKETQRELATHANPAVRRRLAENPQTAIDVLEQLAIDADPEVRAGLAWNHSVSAELLENLCRDQDVNVRLALTENHRLPQSILAILADDENPFVQHAARSSREVLEMEMNLESQYFSHKPGEEAKLGDLLCSAGWLDRAALSTHLDTAQKAAIPLGHVLIRDGNFNKNVVGQALMLQYAVRTGIITSDQATAQMRKVGT